MVMVMAMLLDIKIDARGLDLHFFFFGRTIHILREEEAFF